MTLAGVAVLLVNASVPELTVIEAAVEPSVGAPLIVSVLPLALGPAPSPPFERERAVETVLEVV